MAEFNTVEYMSGTVSFTRFVLIHGSKIINYMSKLSVIAEFSFAVIVTVTNVNEFDTANI